MSKSNKKELLLTQEEIVFTDDGDFGVVKNDITSIGQIISVLKGFKNPYIGNKRKLIPFLIETIDKHGIEYNSVLDLFSGSAFVSMAFKMLDKRVIANDLLTCSYLNSVAFVENRDVSLTEEDKMYLFSGTKKIDSFIGDKYKNYLNENEVSIILNYYDRLVSRWGGHYGCMKASLAIVYMQNYIIENCFVGGRLNSGQILAKYEHRIAHQRNKGNSMFFNGRDFSYSDMRWTNPIYPTDGHIHECYNMDAVDLLKIPPCVDLVYIDPPYGGSQSDYGFMYALFEELIYNRPYEEIEKERFGANRFINKTNYKDNFDELMRGCSHMPNIMISYNDTSWGTIEEILEVVKKYRDDVVVEEFDYSYNYRNQDKNDKKTKEYVIVAKE